MLKTCYKCQEPKNLSEFSAQHDTKDQKQVYCKECKRALSRESYQKSKTQKQKAALDNYYKNKATKTT